MRIGRWDAKQISLLLFGAAILSAAALSFSWASKRELKAGAYQNFNVLLITLDTTRADHLPMYGYTGVKTPNLDRLANNDSFIFEDAVSHAPLTLPAHASILTGLLPPAHGVRDNTGFFLDQKIVTLPEILKARGYDTNAFVSAFVLDSRWQLNQGFDSYHDFFSLEEFNQLTPQDAQRRAAETVSEAAKRLQDNHDRPFFSWVHFYDPHDPYDPPEPFKTEYSSRPYDGEIAYMDVSIGRLLDAISSSGLKQNTIIIVTADHGEGLGQHQELTHAMFVYNTTQHVPLLIHVPGTKGRRVPILARHIDLAPTILDLLGVDAGKQMHGNSLIPFMNGGRSSERTAYIESIYGQLHFGWSPVRSLVTMQFKYIDLPKPELYDRIRDPQELHNLFVRQTHHAKVLKNQLDQLSESHPDSSVIHVQKNDPEAEEGLRALGYIGNVTTRLPVRNIDPKDRIHLARDLQKATVHVQSQQYEHAIKLLLGVLREDPEITDAHFLAGVSYIGLKRYEQAINELNETLSARPDHLMSLYNLGYAYERKGEEKEALRNFLRILELEPLHLYANVKVAHLYRRGGESQTARPYFLNAVNGYLRFLNNTKNVQAKSALHARVGESYFGAGDLMEAEQHFRSAIDLTPHKQNLHYNLGSVYELQGNVNGAIQAYLREIELNPGDHKAFNNLGLIYKRTGQHEKAAFCFRRIIELLPNEPHGYFMLASLYQEMGRIHEANQLLQKLENQVR